jgi:hypothetical protein
MASMRRRFPSVGPAAGRSAVERAFYGDQGRGRHCAIIAAAEAMQYVLLPGRTDVGDCPVVGSATLYVVP